MARYTLPISAMLLVLAANCSGRTDVGTDAGDARVADVVSSDGDSSLPDNDANSADAMIDSGPTDDVPVSEGGTDSGSDADAISPSDSGGVCSAGVECPNYAAILSAAPRGATSLDNCVIQLHQSDCCGTRRAYGINHAARTTLCPAETSCLATYPTPSGCSDSSITTDSGESTTNAADVKIRIVDPMPCGFDPTQTCYTCQTFVCNNAACAGAPGIAGGCGP